MQSHLTLYYNEIYIFTSNYECLVKIMHFRHKYSSILCKILKKPNKIKRLSITCSHIWHFDISVLIKYTISESFRHEWSIIMYENTKKTQYNQRACHNLRTHLACRYIEMCMLTRHIFCEILVKICATKHKCRSLLCFLRHRLMLPTCPEKWSRTLKIRAR